MIPDTANRRSLRLMLCFHRLCQLREPLQFYSLVSLSLVLFRKETRAGSSIGGKARRLSSSVLCLVRAKQHMTGSSHRVRWDWKKVKGRSCRDIVLLPTQYQPIEFAQCMDENTFCLRMDFRSRTDSLHARMLCLLSLESWGANLSLTWVNGFSQELNKVHSLL